MSGRRLGAAMKAAAALLATTMLGSNTLAHDLPLDTVVNAFVKVEPREIELVVRVPLDLLHSVQFPMKGAQYDVAAAGPATQEALRALADSILLWENGSRLAPSSAAGRFTLPSDRSFTKYDRAAAHVAEPFEPDTRIYYDQGFFDARFRYPIANPSSVFSVQTTVAPDLKEFVKLSVRYLPLRGRARPFLLTTTSGRVSLNPAWYHAARGFVALGIEHILSGVDHLLFLLCLVIPFRRIRAVVPVVTAFTVAHSFTLIGAAYHLAPDGAWFPPFVETAIAASIVYMALENIVGHDLRRRWMITGLFGLVHGFGFSQGLQQRLQFAGSHLLISLFSFNVGIEIGQLLVLALLLPAFTVLRRLVPERTGVLLVSAVVAHTAWHWTQERWDQLARVEGPRFDAASMAVIGRWLASLAAASVVAWAIARWTERRSRSRLHGAQPSAGT